MADGKGAIEKAMKIASDVDEKISKIKSSISKFEEDMSEMIRELDEITSIENLTERMKTKRIEDTIQKINNKHEQAQKWVNDQLDQLRNWVNEQIDRAESSFKKLVAREEVSILETAGQIQLDEDMVDKLAESIPVSLPRPNIPEITIPKPNISIPEIPISIPKPSTVIAGVVEKIPVINQI